MSDPYADDAARAQRFGRRVGALAGRWRGAVRTWPWLNVVYKTVVTVVGIAIVIAGLIIVPLPGPGWLIVFVGLTVLATEYHWARKVLTWLRGVLAKFWAWWHAWRSRRRARRARRVVLQRRTA